MQLLVAQTTTSKFARTSCRCCRRRRRRLVSRYSDSENGLNRKSRRRNSVIYTYDSDVKKKERKKEKLIDLSLPPIVRWTNFYFLFFFLEKTYVGIFLEEIEKRFMKMGEREAYVGGWKAGRANNTHCIKLIYIYGLTVGIQATIKLSRNKLRLRFQVEPCALHSNLFASCYTYKLVTRICINIYTREKRNNLEITRVR